MESEEEIMPFGFFETSPVSRFPCQQTVFEASVRDDLSVFGMDGVERPVREAALPLGDRLILQAFRPEMEGIHGFRPLRFPNIHMKYYLEKAMPDRNCFPGFPLGPESIPLRNIRAWGNYAQNVLTYTQRETDSRWV